MPAKKKSSPTVREKFRTKFKSVDSTVALLLITVFQVVSFTPVVFADGVLHAEIGIYALGYLIFEWFYLIFMKAIVKKVNFELECIALFLSGIGLCLTASVSGDMAMLKQLITVLAGVIVYDILLWFVMDLKRVTAIKTPLAVFSLLFLGGTFAYIYMFVGDINGAYNWIYLGGISFQPSEFVKIAFVFVGAATLDKLLTAKNIYLYILYALGCIGVLFLMKDFGTALIFFATFILLAFLRSGDYKTILLICAAAVVGVIFIIALRPHVASRFESYRHIWEDVYGRGYQQTRVLIYAVSGGLFGLGVGGGALRNVYAATTDLVFGMVCEELGILVGFVIVLTFACLLVYSLISSKTAPSAFYSIAAVAASAMLLVQISLNIFGITDILPLTGVTLPFVSQGGSSMICCWALFAFIKSADIRAYPKIYRT